MWFSLKTSSPFASQLSFLLHKHPEKLHLKEWSQLKACLYFYSCEPQELGCTIQLTHIAPTKSAKPLPLSYAHCGIALNKYFSSAMNGVTDEAEELVDHHFHWTVQMGLHSDSDLLSDFATWIKNSQGFVSLSVQAGYLEIELKCPLKILLRTMYVLLIAADQKSHLVTQMGSRDLLAEKGKDWLEEHPDKVAISNHFLSHNEHPEPMNIPWKTLHLKEPHSGWMILGPQNRIQEICTLSDSNTSMIAHCYTNLMKSQDPDLRKWEDQSNLLLWHPGMKNCTYLLLLLQAENYTTIINILSRYQWWAKNDWKRIYLLSGNSFEAWKSPTTFNGWTSSVDYSNERYTLYQLKRNSDAS